MILVLAAVGKVNLDVVTADKAEAAGTQPTVKKEDIFFGLSLATFFFEPSGLLCLNCFRPTIR